MADENDSRTASVGQKRPLKGDYDNPTAKRARLGQTDDFVALDSSAESGEIVSDDDEEEPMASPAERPNAIAVDPDEEQLAQIRAAQDRFLKSLTIFGPKGGSDVTPKESKMTTKLKKMKNRVIAISVIAPNAQHTYGQDHVKRLSESLLQWVGSHPTLLSHVTGLLMLTADGWRTLRPNAHRSHILLRMNDSESIDGLLSTIAYSNCPISGAQAALLDAFKVNTMPSSADLSQTYRQTWADEALRQILKGRVQRMVTDLRLGNSTFEDCVRDYRDSDGSNFMLSSGTSSASKPSTVAHTPNAFLPVEDITHPKDSLDSLLPPPPPPLRAAVSEAELVPPLPKGPPPVLLSDLPPDLQALQLRYWPHTSENSLAICEICSVPGHASTTCPDRTCSHCSTDVASAAGHFSSACPKSTRCGRCKITGHTAAACSSKLSATADESSAMPCENCLVPGHEAQQCEWLWRTYTPIVSGLEPAIPVQLQTGIPISRRNAHPPPKARLVRQCYNCAKESHLGDDCPLLPTKEGSQQRFGLFGAEWSNLFASNPYAPPPPRPSGGGSMPQQNSHIIFTEDTDDDESMDISDDDAGSERPSHSQPRPGLGHESKPARHKKPKKAKAKQEPAYTFQSRGPDTSKGNNSSRNKKQDIRFSTAPDSFMSQAQGQSHRGMNATGIPPKPPPRVDNRASLESRITGGGYSGGRGNRSRGGGNGRGRGRRGG